MDHLANTIFNLCYQFVIAFTFARAILARSINYLCITILFMLTRYLGIVVILLVFGHNAYGQWARGADKGYVQVSFGTATASDQFNASRTIEQLGGLNDPQRYSENAVYVYAELGLSEDVTFIGSTFYKDITVQTRNGNLTTQGLSDLTLQLRYTVYKSSALVVSPEFGVRIPTGYDPDASPPLGSGEADLFFTLNSGLSLYPIPGYFGASIGTRLRGGAQQDEIVGHFEAGYFVHPKLLIRGRFDGLESTTNSNNGFNVTNQVFEQGFFVTGPGITFLASERVQLSVDGRWTVAGRTSSQLTNYLFGVAILW